eukprot:5218588-Pleurochrysis_carterae.AAC.1
MPAGADVQRPCSTPDLKRRPMVPSAPQSASEWRVAAVRCCSVASDEESTSTNGEQRVTLLKFDKSESTPARSRRQQWARAGWDSSLVSIPHSPSFDVAHRRVGRQIDGTLGKGGAGRRGFSREYRCEAGEGEGRGAGIVARVNTGVKAAATATVAEAEAKTEAGTEAG